VDLAQITIKNLSKLNSREVSSYKVANVFL